MAIYIIGTFLSLLFSAISVNLSNNKKYYYANRIKSTLFLKRLFSILSFVPFAAISAARYDVGIDYFSYTRIYASQMNTSDGTEPLFTVLIKALQHISSDPRIFFIVSSIIICGSYFYAIYKYSEDPPLSILLFLLTLEYFRSMSAIRQYLALAIMFFSFSAIKQEKAKVTIPIILIASMMHNSALLGIFLAFLYWLKLTPGVMIFASAGCALFSNTILSYIFPVLKKFTRFARYFERDSIYSDSAFTVASFLIYTAFFAMFLYLTYIEHVKLNSKARFLLNGVFLGLCFVAMSSLFPINIRRAIYYIDSLVVIYTPSMLRSIRERKIATLIKCCLITGYLIFFIGQILLGHDNHAIPYRSFWQ